MVKIVVNRMKNQGTILTKIMFFNQLFDKMFLKNDVCLFVFSLVYFWWVLACV